MGNHHGTKINSFRELASYLGLQVRIDGHGLMHYVENVPMFEDQGIVDVYVEGIEFYDYDIALLDATFPMDIVMRVDRLSPGQAMHLQGRGFKTNSVVNITLKNREELAMSDNPYAYFCLAKQMACQQHTDFTPSETAYASPVIFWNPSVTTTKDNKALVSFKTPDVPNATYRIVLEGITDNGIPVHQEKHILLSTQCHE